MLSNQAIAKVINVMFPDGQEILRALNGAVVATSIAALAAIGGNDVGNGATVFVESNKSQWILDTGSTQTPDGITCVAAPTGRWLRNVTFVHPFWTSQTNWDLDAVTGNDESSGLANSGHPVKTVAEICRRIAVAKTGSTYTVNWTAAGAPPSTDIYTWAPLLDGTPSNNAFGGAILRLKGVAVAAVTSAFTATAASTITGVQSATSQARVTDNSVTWSAQIGNIIQITSGAASGALMTVMADLGGGIARVSDPFTRAGVATAMPSPGDTYVINTFPSLNVAPSTNGAGKTGVEITVEDMKIPAATGAITAQGIYHFIGCRIEVTIQSGNRAHIANDFFGCGHVMPSFANAVIAQTASTFQWFGGAVINGIVTTGLGGRMNFRNSFQASRAIFTANQPAGFGMGVRQATGFFDAPAGAPAIQCKGPVNIFSAAIAGATGLYGYNPLAPIALNVSEGGEFFMFSGQTPTISAVQEIALEGATTAIPELVAGGAVPAASALTTWAELLAAPFSGFAMSYKTGSKFRRTS